MMRETSEKENQNVYTRKEKGKKEEEETAQQQLDVSFALPTPFSWLEIGLSSSLFVLQLFYVCQLHSTPAPVVSTAVCVGVQGVPFFFLF